MKMKAKIGLGGREILFRGKCVISGEWAESYCPLGVMHGGTIGEDFKTETVGQYIGRKDADGAKVFEGDIVQYYGEGWDEEDGPGVVEWDGEAARFVITLNGLTVDFDNCYPWEVRVIGNIHDNPELMEERL